MTPDIFLVCGFGRCGSSLVLRMLAAGGMPVAGEFPDYEPFSRLPTLTTSLAALDGRAVKLLDPQRHPLPAGPRYRAVWLDRDRHEQGQSMAKFLAWQSGRRLRKSAARRFAASFAADRPAALAHLRAACLWVETLSFERILSDPHGAATWLSWMLSSEDLDLDAMARVVIERTPACRPDMSIEAALAAGEGAA